MGDMEAHNPHAQTYCIRQCLFDNDGTGEMVRCCLCQKWYHGTCLGLSEDDETGVWCCFQCRNIYKETTIMKTDIKKMLVTMETIQQSMQTMLIKQDDYDKKLENKEKECHDLRVKNMQLMKRVEEMLKEHSETKKSEQVVSDVEQHDMTNNDCMITEESEPSSLLLGDSLIRKTWNWKLAGNFVKKKIGGAKICRLNEEIAKHPDRKFSAIYLVAGTNDCNHTDVTADEALASYIELLETAGNKLTRDGTIFVSSIPPRSDNLSAQQKGKEINEQLSDYCVENGHTFVNNDQTFYLYNGQINSALFEKDKLHLNAAGTTQLLVNMGIQVESCSNATIEEFTNDEETVYFRSHKDELSNFYPCNLQMYGRSFHSSEAAFQYRKALHYDQWQKAECIVLCKRACDAKAVGDEINHTCGDDTWHDKRTDVMLEILEAKANQCPSFRQRLLKTGDKQLIENTTNEFWARGKYGDGENKLGLLLMLLRQKIVNEPENIQVPSIEQGSISDSPSFRVIVGNRTVNRNCSANTEINTYYQQAPRSIAQSENTDFKYRCKYCKEYSHVASACGFRGPVKCRQCNVYGHKQKFCHEFRR